MKRILILLMLVLLVAPVVASVSPVKSDFQDPDINWITYTGSPSITTDTSGRSLMYLPEGYFSGAGIKSNVGIPFTYAAFSYNPFPGYGTAPVVKGWVGGSNIFTLGASAGNSYWRRCEVVISGGTAYLYVDDALVSSATSSVNPSDLSISTFQEYGVGGHGTYLDDIVLGYNSDSTVVGVIPSDWFILSDSTSPASTGLYQGATPTLKNSNTFGVSYGRDSPDATTLNLVNPSGTTIKSYPVANMTAQLVIPITDLSVGGSQIQNGLWSAKLGDDSTTGYFRVMTSGAYVAWDSDTYSLGDTGTASYTISDSYWNPTTTDYSVDVQDIFGNVIKTQIVNSKTGTVSVTFTDTDTIGVYYVVVKSTLKSGVVTNWMNYDTTELQAYISYSGYVMNAESGALLTGASVNVTQGTATKTSLSGSYGWNSTNNWLSGSQFNITTNLTGYTSDVRLFTPLTSKSISLNISLIPSPATTVGLSVGGVVRDNVYGNPVTTATYWVQNGTVYSSTTNIAGFARVDNLPVPNTWYNVWSSKTGFGNSSVVQVMAVGT